MKRITALCLVMFIICGILPVSAAEKESDKAFKNTVYSNNFTEYPFESHLGGINTNYPLEEDNLKVYYNEAHGNVLKASMKKAGNDGHYVRIYGAESGSAFKDITKSRWEITADVLLDAVTRLDVSVWMGSAQAFFVPLRFNAGGKIECGYKGEDGAYKSYMSYKEGKWYQIKLYLDLYENTYSLAVNGKQLEADTPYSFPYDNFYAALYFALNGLSDEVTGGDNWLYIDNISVSNESVFGKSYKNDEAYGHTAFSDDFENGIKDALWEIPDKTGVVNAVDPSGKRGSSVRLSGTHPRLYSGYSTAGKKHILENYTTEEIGRIRIKADFRFDDLKENGENKALNLFAYDAYNNEISTLVSFNKNNPIYYPFGQTSGINLTSENNFKSGVWYSVTMYFDMEQGLGTFKVEDGEKELTMLEDFDLTKWSGYSGKETRIDSLRFEAGTSTEGAAYIDNVSYCVAAPEPKLEFESNTEGCAYYTYFPDLYGGKEATLIAAVSSGEKLVSVKTENIKPEKLKANELTNYGKYAAQMTDEDISAHHAVKCRLRFKAKPDETVCLYLWDGFTNCTPLIKATEKTVSVEYGENEAIPDYCFENAAEKWRNLLVGDENNNTENELVSQSVTSITNAAQSAWNRQKSYADDDTVLFLPITTTADMTQQYVFINNMAKAWGTKGSTLYKNSDLLSDIISALDYMYNNYYGKNEIEGNPWRNMSLYNWWDWLVGVPAQMTETLIIIKDEISQTEINRYLSPFEYIMEKDGAKHDAGSRVSNGLALAVLKSDTNALEKYMEDLAEVLKITPQTFGVNGIKADGTYIEHLMYLYNAGYGVSIVAERGITFYGIFKNTGLLPQTINTDVIELAVHEMFEPILYKGGLFSSFSGRRSSSEADGGRRILAVLLDTADLFDDAESKKIRSIIKRNVTEENINSLANTLTVNQATVLGNILKDNENTNTDYERAKIYYAGDAAVQQINGYAAALSMSSKRRANYESINGMNKNGWYQSDGALYVYTDAGQFDENWWAERNPYHMPGTTVDTQEREERSIYYTEGYLSNQDFAGGAELGKFAVAAMELEAFHNDNDKGMTDTGYGGSQPVHSSTLTAKKSWFFFDDEIVCLGSDINANDGFTVETVIDNRMLSGNETIYAGGESLNGASFETIKNASGWAHIEGFGGYWLPNGVNLHAKKTSETKSFLEFWISHGVNPQNASYCYAVLPNKTAEETSAYYQNPDVTVLANNENVQAVCDEKAGLSGMVFYSAGSCENVTVSEPMTLLLKREGNKLTVAIADPTQALNTATIRICGAYTANGAAAGIEAENGEDYTELTINFAESGGKTFTAELKVN